MPPTKTLTPIKHLFFKKWRHSDSGVNRTSLYNMINSTTGKTRQVIGHTFKDLLKALVKPHTIRQAD